MKRNMIFRLVLVILSVTFTQAINAQDQNAKINITDFHVVKTDLKVSVNWSTDNGGAANYFELEKSNDGVKFKTVAYVLGADPSKSDKEAYGYFDKIKNEKEKLYYRLKHVSLSGDVEYSEVEVLSLKN
ncbi:MAG: hypothetical protein ABIP35_15865 [Ginsengibacter sp.]